MTVLNNHAGRLETVDGCRRYRYVEPSDGMADALGDALALLADEDPEDPPNPPGAEAGAGGQAGGDAAGNGGDGGGEDAEGIGAGGNADAGADAGAGAGAEAGVDDGGEDQAMDEDIEVVARPPFPATPAAVPSFMEAIRVPFRTAIEAGEMAMDPEDIKDFLQSYHDDICARAQAGDRGRAVVRGVLR